MTYDKKIYTSKALFIIYFLCLNNMLIIYNITGVFDIFRIPLQLFIMGMFLVKMADILRKRYVKKNKYTAFAFLILIMVVYFGGQVFFQSIDKSANGASLLNNISNSIFSLIVFLLFFEFRENEKKFDYQKTSIIVFLLVSAMYLYFRINMPVTGNPHNIYHAQYANSIYYVIFMLPFVLRSKWRYLFWGIAGICVLLSGKQGAFIAFVLGVVFFYFAERKVSKRPINIKLIIAFIAFFIFSVFAYWFVANRLGMDILSGFQSISEDGGNGRLDIYLRLISLLKKSSFVEILFGHGGLNSVANTLGISAHNDFFEILFDFGIIALIIYIAFILRIVILFFDLLKRDDDLAPSMIYTISAFITLSMLSHLIFVLKYCLLLMAFWGICISESREEEKRWRLGMSE